MSIKPTLISSFIHQIRDSVFALQVFNIIRFTTFFLVSILLVKIPLRVEQIGTYEYALFLSSIVTGWWIQGFVQSFMADSSTLNGVLNEKLFRDYSRLFMLFGVTILVVLVVIIEVLAATSILNYPPDGFYFFLFFHFILQASILMVYYFHQRGWTDYIYIFALYFFVIYVGSFYILLKDGSTLAEVYTWLAGFSIPLLLVWLYYYLKSGQESKDSTLVRHFPHLSVLMLIQGIGFVSLWSDGFWVQYFYGTEDMFALFRYGGREFPLFVILTTTFSTAMIQIAGRADGLSRIRQGSVRFIRFFIPVLIVLLLTSQWLFEWVYSEDFIPASFIFDAYLLLVLVRVLFPRSVLIASRQFRSLLWISIGELVINVVLSIVFYWVLGIFGLILATLIAHFFELGSSLFLVSKKLNIKLGSYVPIRLYLIFSGGFILLFVFKYTIFSSPWLDILVFP